MLKVLVHEYVLIYWRKRYRKVEDDLHGNGEKAQDRMLCRDIIVSLCFLEKVKSKKDEKLTATNTKKHWCTFSVVVVGCLRCFPSPSSHRRCLRVTDDHAHAAEERRHQSHDDIQHPRPRPRFSRHFSASRTSSPLPFCCLSSRLLDLDRCYRSLLVCYAASSSRLYAA